MPDRTTGALIVNFFGGPGSGKTTAATQLFVALKMRSADVELHYEIARRHILMGQASALDTQPYLFGLALYHLKETVRNTDIVIMDSPLLLHPVYDKSRSEGLRLLCLEEHQRFRNLNIVISRPRGSGHSMVGRMHNLQESIRLDAAIEEFLERNSVPYIRTTGAQEEIERIADQITRDVTEHRRQLDMLATPV